MKLLHLDSSINGDQSASRALSAAIVKQFCAADGDLQVAYQDLAANPFDHLTLESWKGAETAAVTDEFLAADVVVLGVALYNFSIPSQLKAWIDRILIAGKTFRYTAKGAEGLAGGKRVVVALARGAVYSGGSPFASFEHAETLLRGTLAFIGIADPEFVVAEGLAMGEDARRAALDAALAQVRQLEMTQRPA